MFLCAPLLGVWKYRQIATLEDYLAQPYVDIAHRGRCDTALPLLLIATFLELSGWSSVVDRVAAGAMAPIQPGRDGEASASECSPHPATHWLSPLGARWSASKDSTTRGPRT